MFAPGRGEYLEDQTTCKKLVKRVLALATPTVIITVARLGVVQRIMQYMCSALTARALMSFSASCETELSTRRPPQHG